MFPSCMGPTFFWLLHLAPHPVVLRYVLFMTLLAPNSLNTLLFTKLHTQVKSIYCERIRVMFVYCTDETG